MLFLSRSGVILMEADDLGKGGGKAAETGPWKRPRGTRPRGSCPSQVATERPTTYPPTVLAPDKSLDLTCGDLGACGVKRARVA